MINKALARRKKPLIKKFARLPANTDEAKKLSDENNLLQDENMGHLDASQPDLDSSQPDEVNALLNEIMLILSASKEHQDMQTMLLRAYQDELNDSQNELLALKRKIKISQKEKIRVVFMLMAQGHWKAMATTFHALLNDDAFEVFVVPRILGLLEGGELVPVYTEPHTERHENTYTDPHMEYQRKFLKAISPVGKDEDFFKDFPCKIMDGYDYEKHEWLDLNKLQIDYIFFPTPYFDQRPAPYINRRVSRYATICYIHYGIPMLKELFADGRGVDLFQRNCLVFAETRFHQELYREIALRHNMVFNSEQVHNVGHAAGEYILENIPSEDEKACKWKASGFKVLWTPRWRESEGNCFFRDYKDLLPDYCEEKKYPFVFRSHPSGLLNMGVSGLLTAEDLVHMQLQYQNSTYCDFDLEGSPLPIIHSADVLVTDPSGFIMEFLVTGKPIIYCHRTRDWGNDFFFEILEQAAYWVHNFEELKNTLDMLASGNDPLKDARKALIANPKYVNTQGVGERIKDIIKADFYASVESI